MHYGGGKTFDFYGKFWELQEKLNDRSFARCHKSVLVNLHFVDEIRKEEILLTSGERLPLGSSYLRDFKMAFSQYLSEAERE